MESLARIRNILGSSWRNASSEPSFLVPGLAISTLVLFESSYLSETLGNISIDSLSSDTPLSPMLLLITPILSVSLLKTLLESQLYLSVAAVVLRRPVLLEKTSRMKGALRYISIEICSSLFLCFSLIPLAITSELKNLSPTTSLFAFLAFCFFGILLVATSLVKYILFGYALLSPLGFRSALRLSINLFARHQQLSVLFFLIVGILLSLFTFLQNLVMLQGAFLHRQTGTILIEVVSYTALLLLGTFVSLFFTVLWVHFFLFLTNRQSQEKVAPAITREEVFETPPVV